MTRRLGVVDDDVSCLEFYREELESIGWEVHAYSEIAAVDRAAQLWPSFALLILDLELPGECAFDWLRRWTSATDVPVLVVSSHESDDYVFEALRRGASGYLTKYDAPDRLVDAIEQTCSGGSVLTPSIARRVLAHWRGEGGEAPTRSAEGRSEVPFDTPSGRELDVLTFLSRGLTYQETADVLGIRVDTVRAHVRSVYRKLHASTKAEAVAVALRHGWLQ